mgnify:FL=1
MVPGSKDIIVADSGNNRIQILSFSGNLSEPPSPSRLLTPTLPLGVFKRVLASWTGATQLLNMDLTYPYDGSITVCLGGVNQVLLLNVSSG